ncbi:hypothetical protein ED208_03380 [Stagnimonas aquatica]|uniref:Uncharacterized protein n=1 Tax=Stagnimonas aquatica TaxID=2689987 RepID=A0A3N0VLD5_9GAMM|nr:hypothetical protein [Stagnimonas aquatica]ROH93576.1 hypothetical protein ED208_03380 [Stagnimonas aquatica]
MTEPTQTPPDRRRKPRLPLAELLLIFGLPAAVLAAGVLTILTASRQGFTPIAETSVAPKGH